MRCFGCYKSQEGSGSSSPQSGDTAGQIAGSTSQSSPAASRTQDRPQASETDTTSPRSGRSYTKSERSIGEGSQWLAGKTQVLETQSRTGGTGGPLRASQRASTRDKGSSKQRKTERPSRDISAAEATAQWVPRTQRPSHNTLHEPARTQRPFDNILREPAGSLNLSVARRRGSSSRRKKQPPLECIREVPSRPSSVDSSETQTVLTATSGEVTKAKAAASAQHSPVPRGDRGRQPEIAKRKLQSQSAVASVAKPWSPGKRGQER